MIPITFPSYFTAMTLDCLKKETIFHSELVLKCSDRLMFHHQSYWRSNSLRLGRKCEKTSHWLLNVKQTWHPSSGYFLDTILHAKLKLLSHGVWQQSIRNFYVSLLLQQYFTDLTSPQSETILFAPRHVYTRYE